MLGSHLDKEDVEVNIRRIVIPENEEMEELLLDILPLCRGKVKDVIQNRISKMTKAFLAKKAKEISDE